MGSNHSSLQKPLILALGHRALRDLPRCTVRGSGERGFNTGGGGTENSRDNGEGGPERTASGNGGVGSGAGARGREETLGSGGWVCVTLPGSLRML